MTFRCLDLNPLRLLHYLNFKMYLQKIVNKCTDKSFIKNGKMELFRSAFRSNWA